LPALCLLVYSPWGAAASSVSVNGVFGEKALIAIGNSPAKVMAVGDNIQGVRLLSVRGQQIVIEQDGKRRTLEVGFGSQPSGVLETQAEAVITADGRGHFLASGMVNSHPVRFLVDTGASAVVLPRSIATSAGVVLAGAKTVVIGTANGNARASKVLLNTIRVGNVSLNLVEAIVLDDAQLKVPLLGMSFLKRTNMKNEGDRLTLSQRY
jgi:aspartyl protease family protein